MSELTSNSYGKGGVRLTKVVRHGERHDLFEIEAAIQLHGDFDAAYTAGDNRQVIATDTIKNTVYVLAKRHDFADLESFAVILARHFVDTYEWVIGAEATLLQSSWRRIDGHTHSFTSNGPQKRRAYATVNNIDTHLTGGVRGLEVLKTTGSQWAGFHRDEYRTLPDTLDRILATKIDADWSYATSDEPFDTHYDAIVKAVLAVFANTHSLGVQQTIHQMGEAALAACDAIDSISFTLPNMHRIPFNLTPLGETFENDIYVATDEPFGLIRGTIKR